MFYRPWSLFDNDFIEQQNKIEKYIDAWEQNKSLFFSYLDTSSLINRESVVLSGTSSKVSIFIKLFVGQIKPLIILTIFLYPFNLTNSCNYHVLPCPSKLLPTMYHTYPTCDNFETSSIINLTNDSFL